MTPKEYLKQAYRLDQKINSDIAEAARLREMASSVGSPGFEEAFSKLLTRVHPGAIVLLHSTSSTNAQILDELLTKWEEMGYTFAPLSDLVEM